MPAQDPFGLKRSLFVLTDPDLPAREATDMAFAAIRGGATHLVVRRPGDPASEVHQMATTLQGYREEGTRARLLVHDRVDVAVATVADGVVLPANGLPGRPAKELLLGPERMLGISVHALDQARSAQLQRADFVFLGNIFETGSHPGRPGLGLEGLASIAERTSLPVIAIGGITAERVADVLAAGASGVAVIRAVSRAGDPEAATRKLRAALDAADYPHLA